MEGWFQRPNTVYNPRVLAGPSLKVHWKDLEEDAYQVLLPISALFLKPMGYNMFFSFWVFFPPLTEFEIPLKSDGQEKSVGPSSSSIFCALRSDKFAQKVGRKWGISYGYVFLFVFLVSLPGQIVNDLIVHLGRKDWKREGRPCENWHLLARNLFLQEGHCLHGRVYICCNAIPFLSRRPTWWTWIKPGWRLGLRACLLTWLLRSRGRWKNFFQPFNTKRPSRLIASRHGTDWMKNPALCN